jgi:hypothetical protein
MSWSYRSPVRAPRHSRAIAHLLITTVGAGTAPAFAAEIYFQPMATLTAENDSNLDLTPQESDYREYPKESADDRLEASLDFRSDYRGQRSDATMAGSIQHLDEFNAELSSAFFDDINPVQPTAPQTGQTVVGETRDSVLLFPKYDYRFSPIFGAGASAIYQNVTYHPSGVTELVDFNYFQGKGFVNWDLNQKSEVIFGAYGSKYNATHIDSTATAYGVSVALDSKWTPLLSTEISVVDQRTTVDTSIPTPFSTVVNVWGATVSADYKAQVDEFRLNAGRSITPTGGGGVYVYDQIQFQYNRNLTQRWTFIGAMIGQRYRGITSNVSGDDRNYLQTVIEAKYMLAATWFVQGGYQYQWQKYEINTDGATNNRIYIRFGYQGLGQQR